MTQLIEWMRTNKITRIPPNGMMRVAKSPELEGLDLTCLGAFIRGYSVGQSCKFDVEDMGSFIEIRRTQ